MSIISKIEKAINTKEEIKNVIEEFGGKVEDDLPFSQYPNRIRRVLGTEEENIIEITENGLHNIRGYTKAIVDVPFDIKADIIECGVYDKVEEKDFVKISSSLTQSDIFRPSSANYVNNTGTTTIKLQDGRIFVCYGGNLIKTSGYYYLMCTIIESLEDITNTKTKTLTSDKNACVKKPICIEIAKNKILIIHTYSTSSHNLYATIVQVSESSDETSVINRIQVSSDSSGYYINDIFKLEENKFMLVHGTSSQGKVSVISIIEDNIVVNSTSNLSINVANGSAFLLNQNKLLQLYNLNNYLGYVFYEINENYTLTLLSNDSTSVSSIGIHSSVLIGNNSICVFNSIYSSSTRYPQLMLFNILEDNTLLLREKLQLNGHLNPSLGGRMIKLSNNVVYIRYTAPASNSSGATWARRDYVYYVNDNGLYSLKSYPSIADLINQLLYDITLINDKVLIFFQGNNYTLYGLTCSPLLVQRADTIAMIGLTESGGIAGETIKVYVPYPKESEE